MKIPNFLFEQFVDNNIFNTAMAEVLTSIQELGNNDVFLLPGIVNPSAMTFTYTGGLVVNIAFINSGTTSFRCLFQTGAYCSAHGIVNGIDSPNYSVDFTGFVPVTGTQTVYLIANYAQIQESPIAIIGPPPGHPDYSANFPPYTGYTILQDTLNIIVTLTPPDNQINIELGRVNLTAGQTIITALDITNQVLAQVNAKFVTMSGDVTGPSNANVVSAWQGKPINLSAPFVNSVPQWTGSTWSPALLPTSLPPIGPAGSDISGTYPLSVIVNKSSVPTFNANAIAAALGITAGGPISSSANIAAATALTAGTSVSAGTTVTAGGAIASTASSITAATNLIAGGFVQGANAALQNQAVMLGQLSATVTAISLGSIVTAGDIYHNYFTIPIYNSVTSSFIKIKVVFGFYSIYGTGPNLGPVVTANVNYPSGSTFTSGPLFVGATLASTQGSGVGAFNDAGASMETSTIGNGSAVFFIDRSAGSLGNVKVAPDGPGNTGLLGFWWFVVGI